MGICINKDWDLPSGYLTVCHRKSPFLIAKPSINGPFSMAMLNSQMVNHIWYATLLYLAAGPADHGSIWRDMLGRILELNYAEGHVVYHNYHSHREDVQREGEGRHKLKPYAFWLESTRMTMMIPEARTDISASQFVCLQIKRLHQLQHYMYIYIYIYDMIWYIYIYHIYIYSDIPIPESLFEGNIETGNPSILG